MSYKFPIVFLLWEWETEPHYIDDVGVELPETGPATQGFRSLVCITTPCSKSNFTSYRNKQQIQFLKHFFYYSIHIHIKPKVLNIWATALSFRGSPKTTATQRFLCINS